MAGPVEQRLHEVLDERSHIGVVLPGSISERTSAASAKVAIAGPTRLVYGPYATWTWRLGGSPLTRTLTTDQSARLRPYSEAHRRLKQLVSELERLSLQLIAETEGIELASATKVGNWRAKTGE